MHVHVGAFAVTAHGNVVRNTNNTIRPLKPTYVRAMIFLHVCTVVVPLPSHRR